MSAPIANAAVKMKLLFEASAKLNLALELLPPLGDAYIQAAIKHLCKAQNRIIGRPLPRSERSHD